MARKKQSNTKVISIILIVVGIGLLVWAYQMSGSMGSHFSKTFTGSAPDKEMLLYIGGAASLIVGLYMNFKK